MSQDKVRCLGQTKAGTPCRNYAQAGSLYCHLHQDQSAAQPSPAAATQASVDIVNAPTPASRAPQANRAARARLEVLLNELNQLAVELQKRSPDYRPPTYSRHQLAELVSQNVNRFTPETAKELAGELRANLEGTSPKDLADPDTWKGLWYILNYTAENQTASARSYVAERLSGLPGMETVSDLKANLEGTSPKELLDPDTWKGMYYIVNYSLQATARDLKRKVLGDDEEA